jgi:hypothetical protein
LFQFVAVLPPKLILMMAAEAWGDAISSEADNNRDLRVDILVIGHSMG